MILIFLRELGRALMSGKKDSVDFISSDDFSMISAFSAFLALILLKSKPPPVISYLFAFLSSSILIFCYSCSRMYFLKDYSALFWVYSRRYYSNAYFLYFYSRSLCLSCSAFFLLSSSFSNFYCRFFSKSYFSLGETEMLSSFENTFLSSIRI